MRSGLFRRLESTALAVDYFLNSTGKHSVLVKRVKREN